MRVSDPKVNKRVGELQMVCAELYQVLGALASFGDCWSHPDVVRAMDNASAAADGRKIPHKSLLPWPKTQLFRDRDEAAIRFVMKRKR